MMLWHYELIPYLPKSQLVAQWRELNSIFKKQKKHILINYVYECRAYDLYAYSCMVIREMRKRQIHIKSFDNMTNYFCQNNNLWQKSKDDYLYYFYREGLHISYVLSFSSKWYSFMNDRCLLQCFYKLQEKYDIGQKDFTEKQYLELEKFMKGKGLIK